MKPVLTRAEVELCIRLDRAARYRRVCEYGTNTVDRPICHYPYKCPYSTEDN